MTLQLGCLALVLLLALLRIPPALRRPQARPAWFATIAGTLSLTTYGIPIPAGLYDLLLGGQNLLTLTRDLTAVTALWFLREAIAGYARARTRYASPALLGFTLLTLTDLFLHIPHRTPTSPTLVMDQVTSMPSWLYGAGYMAALIWILLDSARMATRHGRGAVRALVLGALITTTGCGIELVVLTAAHFAPPDSRLGTVWGNTSTVPFFTGIAVMLLSIATTTVLPPVRRRLLVSRLRRIGHRQALLPSRPLPHLTVLGTERHLTDQTHRLLVLLGNAERTGAFTPTRAEADVIARARALLHTDSDFRPLVIGKAA